MGFCFSPYALRSKVRYVYPPKVELYRRLALCDILRWTMPAIASLEDLRAAQEDLLAARDLEELKRVFKR